MSSLLVLDETSSRRRFFEQDVQTKLLAYCDEVEQLFSLDDLLNRLHDIISEKSCLYVHGASRFAVKVGDWRNIELGRTTFIHRDVPRGWIDEWDAFVASGHPLMLMTARICLAPFTWTELTRMLDPIGVEQWPFELALKHGMRDGYVCPVGGRWMVGFWSRKVLPSGFSGKRRADYSIWRRQLRPSAWRG